MRRWAMIAAIMILLPWMVSLVWMKAAGMEAGDVQSWSEEGQAEAESLRKDRKENGIMQEGGTIEDEGAANGDEEKEGQGGEEDGQREAAATGAGSTVREGTDREGEVAGGDKAVGSTVIQGESEGKGRNLRKILVERQGIRTYIELEDYLPGVMVCQINGDYHEEALKCQAVVARTYLYRLMEGRTEIYEEELDLDYLGESQASFGADKERLLGWLERCRAAAGSTRGVVMKCNDRYILPLFHSMSAGRTRTGDGEFPYLQSVESGADTKRDDYMQVKEWSRGEFAAAINQISDSSSVTPEQLPEQIQTVKRDDAGYMVEMKIGTKIYSGDQIQYALDLPSPCFSLEGDQQTIRARVRGKGHGYGLSQAGADSMARDGWGYEDILNHYYKNISLISE